MKYYVVSDVHGFDTHLKKALQEAGFFEEREPCRLIVCGDLLDRGQEARRLVDFMLELHGEGRLIYILGNHEELLVQCLQEIARGNVYEIAGALSHHYSNRTWDTLLQLAEMSEEEAVRHPHELVRSVMHSDFYRKLLPLGVDYFETPHHIFTHGWIPCHVEGTRFSASYRYDPDWRRADRDAWRQARWLNGMELACKHRVLEPDKTVVCGHYHCSFGHSRIAHRCSEWGRDADFSPFSAEGILAIDASTYNSGRVNCVVIED